MIWSVIIVVNKAMRERALFPTNPMLRRPPPGALLPPRQRAKPARKSARCGVGTGSPRPRPPHPRPVGNGPQPQAPRTGGRARESAPSPTPYSQARGAPPPGVLVPPHNALSQLARARIVGLLAGFHAHTPRSHSQWAAGPGRTPQGRAVRRG